MTKTPPPDELLPPTDKQIADALRFINEIVSIKHQPVSKNYGVGCVSECHPDDLPELETLRKLCTRPAAQPADLGINGIDKLENDVSLLNDAVAAWGSMTYADGCKFAQEILLKHSGTICGMKWLAGLYTSVTKQKPAAPDLSALKDEMCKRFYTDDPDNIREYIDYLAPRLIPQEKGEGNE